MRPLLVRMHLSNKINLKSQWLHLVDVHGLPMQIHSRSTVLEVEVLLHTATRERRTHRQECIVSKSATRRG